MNKLSVTHKQTFIQGTMILLGAGVLNRLLGFVPRILLPRYIGKEALGLYQMAYPPFIVLVTLITGGIPLAVSKFVAEAEAQGNEDAVRRILITALCLTVPLSIGFALICLWIAPWLSTRIFTDSRVLYAFLVMSPIIILVSVSSVFRGYFQGRHNMIPTAASQIVETIARSVATLAMSVAMLPYGVEYAAAGAMAGVLLGEMLGLAVLLWQYARTRKQKLPKAQAAIGTGGSLRLHLRTMKKLLTVSIPVTGSKLVGSFSYFFESVVIVRSLAAAGVAAAVTTAQYGMLSGMVIPILLLPGALTYSLAVSLVPSLSEAASRKNMRLIHMRLHQSLRLALVTGAPFAVFMYVLAAPICYFLYRDLEAGEMLRLIAPAAIFMYFQAPLQAALQALDKPGAALLNTLAGSIVKLLLIYLLAAKTNLGISGAVIAIGINIVLVTLLHWQSVVRATGVRLPAADFLKVAAAAVGMGIICYVIMYKPLPFVPSQDLARFLFAGITGMTLYVAALFPLGLVDKQDLTRIPWIGRKLARYF
ncbi:stage V sporulation protein B [Xylanibacillus composti]|uniref:Stage V sporulation protein B n=1 Tax=Xylanibacillus composti TaxID=1572762 RepID=A0A8J4H719_9BACL|nr:stage V sporulation protein B [Xylanibacillus composti]GIQ70134.1 stage V sporulation protein B [Xylanibacillus composti]